MVFPVRCMSCNKVVGNRYETYIYLVTKKGLSKREALDKMKMRRMCCRMTFLGYFNTSAQPLYKSASLQPDSV